MKKSFSTVACMHLDWKSVLANAAFARMDAIEIRMDADGRVFGLEEDKLKTVAEAFSEKNIEIVSLGTSVQITEYSREMLEKARFCVKIARILGAKAIRVFLGSFVKRFSTPVFHDIDGMARLLSEMADDAKEKNIEIRIETHNEFSTGKVLLPLLKRINRPNVSVIWDILHSIEYGETPEETLRLLGTNIAHVHIKDGRKTDDPDAIDYLYTPLGEGTLPIASILTQLQKSGYQGCISLEWENAWRPEIQNTYQTLPEILEMWNEFLKMVL